MEGYYYGVLDVHYNKMTAEDTATTAATYAEKKTLASTIEVQITPNYKEGKVYASNVVKRNEKRITSYTVRVNADKVPYTVASELLGRTTDENGVQVIGEQQEAPYVALDFAITLDNGEQELWQLYKGKFAEVSQTAHTDGDSITYQHPTLEATFVPRAYDGSLAAVYETGTNTEDDADIIAAWGGTGVYEPGMSLTSGGGTGVGG